MSWVFSGFSSVFDLQYVHIWSHLSHLPNTCYYVIFTQSLDSSVYSLSYVVVSAVLWLF